MQKLSPIFQNIMFVAAILLVSACTDSQEAPSGPPNLPNDRAGEVVKKAIEFAGGWQTWQQQKTVSYHKTTVNYNDDGSVKNQRTQLHRYRLRPDLKVRMEWQEDGVAHLLLNDQYYAYRFRDGEAISDSNLVNGARNATFGSHYVFCMPFKLADPGVRLEFVGRIRLDTGHLVDKVKTTYLPGTGDAAGLHTWTYYFDAADGRLRANLLEFNSGHFLYSEYLDHQVIDEIHMPTRRLGYRSNADGKKLLKASEITYDSVTFNLPLEADLFAVTH